MAGKKQEAKESAMTAVNLNNGSEHAFNQLGLCCLDLGLADDAVSALSRARELAPKFAPIYENLGKALQAAGRNREAIDVYEAALRLAPMRPAALLRLGDAYMQEPLPEAAAQCAEKALQIEPKSAPGNLLMARALIGSGQVLEGAEYAKKAIELAPGNAVPVAYFGRALQSLGRMKEANEQFRRSIELQPRQGFAYHSLVHNYRIKDDDRPLVTRMAELVETDDLPPREIIQLHYGLGKAFEDLGECQKAMHHFDEANRLDHETKIGVEPFNPEDLDRTAKFLVSTFTPEFLESFRHLGSPSEKPLFVVGMMRSGTTLAEQILSSHHLVGGAGELLFWPENAGSSQKIFVSSREETLNEPKLMALTSEYLSLLEKLSPEKLRVVDKMNTNYLLLGILNIAFPNARIVHMKRHPVDTCLSIWATPVANGIDLCASKQNIVFAYEQYVRIMKHWSSVLPSNRLLTVQYEELVSDRENVTRHMIEFCGLEWDEACMSPEHNTRSVKTPSVWQVRQPVYKSSTERWRKYEPWLGAFAQLFETDGSVN